MEKPVSTIPAIRTDMPDMEKHIVMWMEKFGRQIQATRDMPDCELLFVGDSITEHFLLPEYASNLWNQYYSRRKAINVGSGGDCTEHILWRLENGIFETITPRLVVLLAGTNNTGRRMEDPVVLCAGISALIECIHKHASESIILLFAIFPRGKDANDPLRLNNEKANGLLRGVADSFSFVEFIDINARFLDQEGVLPEAIMPDLLHPEVTGYEIWAESLEPRIRAVLGEVGR